MKATDGVADAVYAEQVAAVFRQLPIALVINLVNAALTAAVLAPMATEPLPLPWFALITAVTVGRALLWPQYRRQTLRLEHVDGWSRRATGAALLAGLCRGIGGAFLFPVVPVVGQIFFDHCDRRHVRRRSGHQRVAPADADGV